MSAGIKWLLVLPLILATLISAGLLLGSIWVLDKTWLFNSWQGWLVLGFLFARWFLFNVA